MKHSQSMQTNIQMKDICVSAVVFLTLQHKLLHLDLVELVGADDDAVAGQVDAAAGLQSFNLLRDETRRREETKTPSLFCACFISS